MPPEISSGKSSLGSFESDGLEKLRGARPARPPAMPLRSLSGKSEILFDGEGVEKRVLLKEHSDVAAAERHCALVGASRRPAMTS